MYIQTKPSRSLIQRNEMREGETIEQRLKRIRTTSEPITDSAPVIYTERRDGVQAQYNIRTDMMEAAVLIADQNAREHIAKRRERIDAREAATNGPTTQES